MCGQSKLFLEIIVSIDKYDMEHRALDQKTSDIDGIDSFLKQASLLIENKCFSEARDKLRLGLSLDPKNVSAWEHLVICNLEMGKPKGAIEALNNLLQIEPTSSTKWGDKGYIHLLLNENSEGIWALKESLKLRPRDVRKWELLAIALITEDQWEEAMDALEKSLDLDPSSAVSWYNLALCHLYFEEFTTALQAVEYAISLDPSVEELAEEWMDLVDDEDLIEEVYPSIDGIAAS